MSKRNGDLVRSAREHVFELFRSAPEDVRLEYHRFERTSDVVRACKEIVDGSELDDAAREVALLCAWFYDACYATGSDDHGEDSASGAAPCSGATTLTLTASRPRSITATTPARDRTTSPRRIAQRWRGARM